ncbi:hypothetical protein ACP275_05G144200 [Erythranthe tilingii]
MKFWKILRRLLDEIFPDWQDEFISYKDLKQQLKLIYPIENLVADDNIERSSKRPRLRDDNRTDESKEVTQEMKFFVKLLEREIKKFNCFFMDKEEEYVIRFKMLKEDVAEAKDSREELMKVGRKLVDFHGEMILLENYSALNYTGLLKILKKYDKRSGDLIRLPFIRKVLHEPFFRTELVNKLAKECEIMIYRIFSRNEKLGPPEYTDDAAAVEETEKLEVPEELEEIKCMENMYLRLTISALRTLKEIRSGSSTLDIFSLPPINQ